MKQLLVSGALLLAAMQVNAVEKKVFRISTEQTDLILQVGDNGRLYQTYLGEKLLMMLIFRISHGMYMQVPMEVSVSVDGKYIVAQEMKIILNRLLR